MSRSRIDVQEERLAQEQAARAEDVPWEAFESDLDPTQGSGHGPQPTPEDPAQPQ